jgi:NAD(P)H-nitrite reductase large subunit
MNESETIICRCEEVTLGELMSAAKQYRCSARELKLRTRAGMGYCGGRVCRHAIDTIARLANDVPDPHEPPLKHQPPVRPVSFLHLGGEAN